MSNQPILYVGPPGVGKTAVVRDSYEHTEVLLLSASVEEDIAGLPYRDGVYERRTTPGFIERIQQAVQEGKKTALFLDEIDKARREVADTLLTLVTHQTHFGIPEEVDIIAAANPPEWGGGDGVSVPMMSRFAIIDFVPNVEEWLRWMAQTHSRLGSAFIQAFSEAIKNQSTPMLEKTGEGFNTRLTCPRTYDLAFRAIGSDKEEQIISGLLNSNAASFVILLAKTHVHKNDMSNDSFAAVSALSRSTVVRRKPITTQGKTHQPIRF